MKSPVGLSCCITWSSGRRKDINPLISRRDLFWFFPFFQLMTRWINLHLKKINFLNGWLIVARPLTWLRADVMFWFCPMSDTLPVGFAGSRERERSRGKRRWMRRRRSRRRRAKQFLHHQPSEIDSGRESFTAGLRVKSCQRRDVISRFRPLGELGLIWFTFRVVKRKRDEKQDKRGTAAWNRCFCSFSYLLEQHACAMI